ncbi:MAG: sulfate ABC transporter substrate-binding protein [Chthoniobacterales bacterium]
MKTKRVLAFSLSLLAASQLHGAVELLNVSYDPTRELYTEFNKAFASHWKKQTGEDVKIATSHGGSGSQSRLIQDGSEADVTTLALAYDIDAIHDKGSTGAFDKPLIPKDWQSRLPHNSSPYTSTIVLLVRKGNPKNIKDWDDLAREDVSVITPNPKTGGGARWNFLAAWSYGLKKFGGDEAKTREFLGKIYKNALKNGLPPAARAGTIAFTERNLGDVSISWENEALLVKKRNPDYEIVTPSISILAEPPVTVVDGYVDRHNTRKQATAYLEYLYTPEGQDIIGKNFYRPWDPEVKAKYASQFKNLNLTTIADFGGWTQAQKTYFSDRGVFDQIIKGIRK